MLSSTHVTGDTGHLSDHNILATRVLDVRDYADIYHAVAAMPSGGQLYVPGIHVIGPAPLVLPSNFRLFGDGYSSQIVSWANQGFTHISDETVITTFVSGMIYAPGENVVIDLLRVSGGWTPTGIGTITHNILFGINSVDCKLSNCWLDGAGWSGVLLRGSGHSAHDCISKANAVDGFEVWGSDIEITHNRTRNNGLAGIEVLPTVGGLINQDGVIVSLNKSNGDSIGIASSPDDARNLTNLIISGNIMRSCPNRAINIKSGGTCKNVVVNGNIIDQTLGAGSYGTGISVGAGVDGFVVSENMINDTDTADGPSAISVEGDAANGVISANQINNCWLGIYSGGTGTGLSFSDNIVANARGAQYGITNGTSSNNL